jgi:hypothetical protein
MKDHFRTRFSIKGWEIQHTRIGITWTTIGGMVYRIKKEAEDIVEKLNNGEAPTEWYKKKS